VKHYLVLAACVTAFAQSTTNTFTSGETGATVVSSDHTQTELLQSINGREIPVQKTETRVLSKSDNGSVTETIVHLYDRNGLLTSTQKTVTEVENHPGGSTMKATTYATDVNGTLRETERKMVDTQTQGATTNTQTVIERPSINGGLQPVEKRSAVAEINGDTTHEDETVYRSNAGSDFTVAERKVADTRRNGTQTTQTTALYQPIADASKLELAKQLVTTTTSNPDGSETKQVDTYLAALPGTARSSDSTPKLWEQDTIHRTPRPDGTTLETVTAQRSDPSRPSQLGAAQQVSETVCRGNCSGQ
jgi:hypothetical protein